MTWTHFCRATSYNVHLHIRTDQHSLIIFFEFYNQILPAVIMGELTTPTLGNLKLSIVIILTPRIITIG